YSIVRSDKMTDNEQGKTIRKNITYDTVEDKEIHEWLESLPPRTHSLYIRKALKEYITSEKPTKGNKDINQVYERLDVIEEKLRLNYVTYEVEIDIKNQVVKSTETEKDTRDDNYVIADHMIKDLGK